MGKPIQFPEQNFVWKGWPADDTREEVNDLPAYRHGDGETISCWRLSWRERVLIFLTGLTWLRVQGEHPPVNVDGQTPFLSGSS